MVDNLSGTPSFEVKTEYDIQCAQHMIWARLKIGNQNFTYKFTVTDEMMHQMQYGTGEVEEISWALAKEFHNYLPWINEPWVYHELYARLMLINGDKQYAKGGLINSHNTGQSKIISPLLMYADINKSVSPYSAFDDTSFSNKADGLPGMTTELYSPCGCEEWSTEKRRLKNIIMHINDKHDNDWSTDRLCEWLDGLHDSGMVDLNIEIPDKEIK